MQAAVGANLVVADAAPHVRALAALATFERKGQGPKEERTVRFYAPARPTTTIWLPRGLYPQARRITGIRAIHDRRLVFQKTDLGWRGQLRDYQVPVLQQILAQDGGVLKAPTGTGKTEVMLAAVAHWGQPTLWIVDQKDLARDAQARMRRLFNLPRNGIGYIGEGAGIEGAGRYITVAMMQTLAKRPDILEKMQRRIGAVVTDEVDKTAAETYARVVTSFPGRYRLGASATPERTDGLEGLMFAIVGPGYTEYAYESAFQSGAIHRPQIHLVGTALSVYGNPEWAEVQRARASDSGRNVLICRLAASARRAGRKVLILAELKPHTRLLELLLRKHFGVVAYAVDGEVPAAKRARVYREATEGRAVLIATRLGDRGLDLPAIDCLILATPGRSGPRVVQQIGRVIRRAQGKQNAIVYDICDVNVPTLKAQIPSRLKAYREHGFEVVRR